MKAAFLGSGRKNRVTSIGTLKVLTVAMAFGLLDYSSHVDHLIVSISIHNACFVRRLKYVSTTDLISLRPSLLMLA